MHRFDSVHRDHSARMRRLRRRACHARLHAALPWYLTPATPRPTTPPPHATPRHATPVLAPEQDLRRVAVRMLSAGRPGETRSAEEDEETVERFEKVLRQQYVIETCHDGHPSRHVWNFAVSFPPPRSRFPRTRGPSLTPATPSAKILEPWLWTRQIT